MSNMLKTDLLGKINNLPHFKSEALLPVFEAVINSIQAIEDRFDMKKGLIKVVVNKEKHKSLPGLQQDDDRIKSFYIEDNGIGFTDKNYDSFCTSDSTYKLERGCKGIGRFLWLKAFDKVRITSTYKNGASNNTRVIDFSTKVGIKPISNTKSNSEINTRVELIGFKEEYRASPSAYKTLKKISQRILEHCLSYYINNNAPTIHVTDGEDTIDLNSMFFEINKNISKDTLIIRGEQFDLAHIKLFSTINKNNNIVYCAHSRDVESISLDKFFGVPSFIDDDDNKFVYTVYINSSYLNQHVNVTRTSFDIPENKSALVSQIYPVCKDELKENIIKKAKSYLDHWLSKINRQKMELVHTYVSEKNPMLRAVLHHCPEALLDIDLNSSEEKIDETLYEYKGKAEFLVKKDSAKLLKTQASSIEEIEEKYTDITTRLSDFQKDQLAGYIIFRKSIIALLEKKLALNKDGRYSNEDIVHDIIFPRRTTTDHLDFESHNMWLIDERLAFHASASSDNKLCDITTSDSQDRPDILTFAEIDQDKIARAVSLVELKKPKRATYSEDPTTQLFRYVKQIKGSKVTLPNGRPLHVNDTTRFYCYAICDITDQIHEFAENHDFARLKGELGYYTYNRTHNAHLEIISFDKLVVDAEQRHKAFFHKLGI